MLGTACGLSLSCHVCEPTELCVDLCSLRSQDCTVTWPRSVRRARPAGDAWARAAANARAAAWLLCVCTPVAVHLGEAELGAGCRVQVGSLGGGLRERCLRAQWHLQGIGGSEPGRTFQLSPVEPEGPGRSTSRHWRRPTVGRCLSWESALVRRERCQAQPSHEPQHWRLRNEYLVPKRRRGVPCGPHGGPALHALILQGPGVG